MDAHLLRLQLRGLRGDLLEQLRHLVGHPKIEAAIRREPGDRRGRFELGMGEVGRVVFRLDHLGGVREGRSRVALLLGREAGLGRVLQGRQHRRRGEGGRDGGDAFRRGLAPCHPKGLRTLACPPPRIGEHRHRAGQAMDRVDTRHRADFSLVGDRPRLGAEMRRVLHGGVQHRVEAYVDGVGRPARRLVAHIEPGHRPADPAEVFRVLQRNVVARQERQGGLCHLAIAEGPAGGGVNHAPVVGGQAILRHGEPCGGGAQQHLAGGGAETAHRLEAGAGREAATGHPQAVDDGVVGPGRSAFHREAGGVEIEFLADGLGEPGIDALTAFDEGAEQAHVAIPTDFEEGGHAGAGLCRHRRRTFRAGLGRGVLRQVDAEEEGARDDPEEAAPREVAHRLRCRPGGDAEAVVGREVVHPRLLRPRPAARRRRWRCRCRNGTDWSWLRRSRPRTVSAFPSGAPSRP